MTSLDTQAIDGAAPTTVAADLNHVPIADRWYDFDVPAVQGFVFDVCVLTRI